MRNWKRLVLIICALGLMGEGGSEEARRFFLCHFGPEVKLVAPKHNKPESCEGTVNIQVKMWNCTDIKEVGTTTRDFLKRVTSTGKEQCEEHCRARGDGCIGRFKVPTSCGFSVPQAHASSVGKTAGCHEGCSGTAFAYCSLYHDGYVQTDEARVSTMSPNCRCVKAK